MSVRREQFKITIIITYIAIMIYLVVSPSQVLMYHNISITTLTLLIGDQHF